MGRERSVGGEPQAHYYRGLALLRLDRLEEAVDELQTFLRLEPDGPAARRARQRLQELDALPNG